MSELDNITTENFDHWYATFRTQPREQRLRLVTAVCKHCASRYATAEMAMLSVAASHGRHSGSMLERIMFGFVATRQS